MLSIKISVKVTKETKSPQEVSRDSAPTRKEVGTGVVKALTLVAVLDRVRQAALYLYENFLN